MGGSEVTWPRHTVGHHQIRHLQPIGHYPAPFQPIGHHPHLAAGPPMLYKQDIPACHTPMVLSRREVSAGQDAMTYLVRVRRLLVDGES